MSSSSINVFGESLLKIMEKGIKCDSWGQRLEAAEEYKRLHTEYYEGMTSFGMDNDTEKRLQSIMKNLRQRSNQLQGTNLLKVSSKDVSLEQIRMDYEEFCEIVKKFEKTLNRRHSSVAIECGQNMLLPTPHKKISHGGTFLTIKIEKIGLKDAQVYVDPFISVSVKDSEGEDLTAVQHTPASYHVADKHLIYDMNVHIQKPLEEFGEDFAVFFEFKHYKEDKDKVSTRCFSFIEKDEIKEGASAIELYKKPVDYKRKKLYLFTEKPLYLHVFYSLEKI